MSAIYGIIRKGNNSCEEQFSKMKTALSVFSFDKCNELSHDSSYYGSGIQFITPEDSYDSFPVFDNESDVVFCSDCFLYNRPSLISDLGLDSSDSSSMSDSHIAFYAFKKWGFSFVERLRGHFSFVLYEVSKKIVHLYSDHFSTRYLVYHNSDDYFSFSTTYKPVLASLTEHASINKEFIIRAYQDFSPMSFSMERITPYEDIYHVDSALHITISLSTGSETRIRYWNPTKNIKPLKLKSQDSYKKAFRDLYEHLVSAMLRSSGEIGIMLSGGLDSSSVLSFAAPLLKKQGKKIYSYTSIPSDDFDDSSTPSGILSNESRLILDQKEFNSNLEPRFINAENKCSLYGIQHYQELINMFVKTPANTINIDKMYENAKKDNCSILLSGGNGNSTISYGFLYQYMSLSVTHLHLIKAYKTMAEFARKYKFSRKDFLIDWINYSFSTLWGKPEEEHYLTSRADEKKYRLSHFRLDHQRKYGSRYFVTQKQRYNFLIDHSQFIQKSIYSTCIGLKHKMITLDPSMTVEMVEFCASLPLDCLVHDGIERALIRDYLKDLMPPSITDMAKPFGRQCADFEFRINRDWNQYKDEIVKYIQEPSLTDFFDKDKLNEMITQLKEAADNHSLDRTQCAELTTLASLGCFLQNHL